MRWVFLCLVIWNWFVLIAGLAVGVGKYMADVNFIKKEKVFLVELPLPLPISWFSDKFS